MRRRGFLLILVALVAFYWKITLTRQFTFLESYDQAYQVLPWLQFEVASIRSGVLPLWTPYEWFGQSLIAQVQPGVASIFTYLLALAPLKDGHIQAYWVHLWFVFMHVVGSWFAYLLLLELRVANRAALLGALLFGTMGYFGSTDWPQMVSAAIWSPLVFLFLFRALRGRAPLASSCLAGLFNGMAWLGGHHSPAIYLTIASVLSFGFVLYRAPGGILGKLRLFGAFAAILGLIGALQILPAAEYGKLALRWTNTGAHQWNEPVIFPEHVASGLPPSGLIHLFIQNADRQFDVFTGVVAFSLALLGVAGAFRRLEVRVFTALALGSLLFSMPRNFFPYGSAYVFFPLVEKARSPSMVFCIFHFAVACLAGFGAEALLAGSSRPAVARIAKAVAIFGAVLFTLYFLVDFLRPALNSIYVVADTRPAMFAFLALLFAALCMAVLHDSLKPSMAAVLLCLLVLVEQGNAAGFYWVHNSEKDRTTFLAPLTETRDLAAFLRSKQPARAEVNRKDGLDLNLGDWYSLPIVEAVVPSMPVSTNRLGYSSDRLARFYGVRYTISKTPTRPDQRDVFTSRTGYKIFENPNALPRVLTVHNIERAPNDAAAISLVAGGSFDLADRAVMTDAPPSLERCGPPDRVTGADFGSQTVRVNVEMACRGLLIVSDNFFPGWRATVDGSSAPILRVNTVVRGIVLEKGAHTVAMRYLPGSVIIGFVLFLTGLGLTAWAVRTDTEPGREAIE
jgi:hypothetical protein